MNRTSGKEIIGIIDLSIIGGLHFVQINHLFRFAPDLVVVGIIEFPVAEAPGDRPADDSERDFEGFGKILAERNADLEIILKRKKILP